jgi:class 3 adenylate cyclase
MDDEKKHGIFGFSQDELNNIDEYRKKRNTAVLTIMFTDIQGFTALTENKGETYVHELHAQHDKILVDIIEEDHAGIVIKYIGDSIMAVFSEPTAAAEKTLKIQRSLHEFNKAHPELDDIKVRIGLHMGQTVIENKMQTDLFGRHVNKASRVESLAAGGHVFISYPVYDSIKSWLIDVKTAGAKFHGSYFLKGISKAEDIYEIYNTDITQPQAPKNARKKNSLFPALPIAAAVLILGIAGLIFMVNALSRTQVPRGEDQTQSSSQTSPDAVAAQNPDQAKSAEPAAQDAKQPAAQGSAQKSPAAQVSAVAVPEVFFLGMRAREPILDFDTPLAVTVADEAQGLTKSVNDIGVGKHLIHYVVSYMVRYYADFSVKEGKNIIKLAFKESYLPNIDVNYTAVGAGEKAEPVTQSDEESYFLYDHKTIAKVDYTGKLSASVSGTKAADGKVTFLAHYSAVLNGKKIAEDTVTIECPANQSDRVYVDEKKLYEDQDHYYFYKYSYAGDSIQFSLGSSFKD